MSDEFDDILENRNGQEQLEAVARMLQSERPLPSPAFRGELARRLRGAGTRPTRRRLRAWAIGMAAAGTLLLASAGIGVAGQGPLAPSTSAAAPATSTSR
jgi:ferric-dicitrate binding protein FerR (iron transport regulator)